MSRATHGVQFLTENTWVAVSEPSVNQGAESWLSQGD